MPDSSSSHLARHRPSRRTRALFVSRLVALILSSALLADPARSQPASLPVNGLVQPVDIYGNVRNIRPDRRALDVYQNDFQRDLLTSYLNVNRRPEQGGLGAPFSLPGDLLAAAVNRYTGSVFLSAAAKRPPTMVGVTDAERRLAYLRYGGFGERRAAASPDDPATILVRRRQLILATGLNAPVERATPRGKGLSSLRWTVAATPWLANDETSPLDLDADRPAPTPLDVQLAARVDLLRDRARREAWDSFRNADYRRAIRSFESAAMLDPDDAESRIGQILAYVTIDAVRTAHALMLELDRRDPNPFLRQLNLADRFADPSTALRVRLTAQSVVESADHTVDVTALYVFVLWHVDRREDALRAARSLAARAPDRSFAAWPEKMRAAVAAPSPASP